MSAPETLESGIAWLRSQAADVRFGRVGVELVIHAGKVIRVVTKNEISHEAVPTKSRGESNDRDR